MVAVSEQVEQVVASSSLQGRDTAAAWLLRCTKAAGMGRGSPGAWNSLDTDCAPGAASEPMSSVLHAARQRLRPAMAISLCSLGDFVWEAYCFLLKLQPFLGSLLTLPRKPCGGGGTTAANVCAFIDLDRDLVLVPNTSISMPL